VDSLRRRPWFVIIAMSGVLSVLTIGVVNAASAIDGDRGQQLISYFANPYNEFPAAKENGPFNMIKSEIKEVQTLDQEDNFYLSSFSKNEVTGQARSVAFDNDTVSFTLKDSKGREYNLPAAKQDYLKMTENYRAIQYLETRDGNILAVNDYTGHVKPNSKFTQLADELYLNAGSDYSFLYEVWYLVTHSTEYAPDVTENPSTPFLTLADGKGDCEDLTILIASILASSSSTQNWEIEMVYFDAKNAGDARAVNHVALYVSTNSFTTFVESTNPDLNGLEIWERVDGWYLDIDRVQGVSQRTQ
jgi:hypothetical protein